MNKNILLTGALLGCLIATAYGQTLEKLKEISTGFGNSYPNNFTVVGSKLFFVAGDEAFQYRLYVSGGSAANTLLLGPLATVNGSISNLVAYKNKLFFSCNDGVNGPELWTSDGTVAGTRLFRDLYPGATGSWPEAFTIAGGKLFFMAGGIDGERRLYVSDGTVAGTVIVWNDYINLFNGLKTFAVLNNDVYFKAFDNDGYGLWKSNGTVAGTVRVRGNFNVGTLGSNFAVLNNKMYFSGDDKVNGTELWVTDGTTAGTQMVTNLSLAGNGAPYALTVYNSKLYFSGSDDTHGNELFVSDGTASGTKLVKDFIAGPQGNAPSQITIYNGLLYILCWNGQELWKSDGSGAGTTLVKTVLPYCRFGAVWNSMMYLVSGSDVALWQSNGTAAGTGPAVADNSIDEITIYATDFYLTEYNKSLYFGGRCYSISPSYEPLRFVAATAIHNFSFTGNGNWSNPANWAGGIIPPSTLLAGDQVVVNGNCILDISVHAQPGSSITVATGKSLVITGSLTII
jgi:ELWxxDGT repeat protein